VGNVLLGVTKELFRQVRLDVVVHVRLAKVPKVREHAIVHMRWAWLGSWRGKGGR